MCGGPGHGEYLGVKLRSDHAEDSGAEQDAAQKLHHQGGELKPFEKFGDEQRNRQDQADLHQEQG